MNFAIPETKGEMFEFKQHGYAKFEGDHNVWRKNDIAIFHTSLEKISN